VLLVVWEEEIKVPFVVREKQIKVLSLFCKGDEAYCSRY